MKLPSFKVGNITFAPASIDAIVAGLGVLLIVLGSPLAGLAAVGAAAANSSDWRYKQAALVPLGLLVILLANLWLPLAAAVVGSVLAWKKVPHALPASFFIAAAVSLIFGAWSSVIIAGVLGAAFWFRSRNN